MHEPIHHLALRDEWRRAVEDGVAYRRSTIGRSLEEVGFIHCSFAHQVQGVADLFYRGRDDVVVLVIDPTRVGADIRVERTDGSEQQFPHLYGPLPLEAVISERDVPVDGAGRLDLASLGYDA